MEFLFRKRGENIEYNKNKSPHSRQNTIENFQKFNWEQFVWENETERFQKKWCSFYHKFPFSTFLKKSMRRLFKRRKQVLSTARSWKLQIKVRPHLKISLNILQRHMSFLFSSLNGCVLSVWYPPVKMSKHGVVCNWLPA